VGEEWQRMALPPRFALPRIFFASAADSWTGFASGNNTRLQLGPIRILEVALWRPKISVSSCLPTCGGMNAGNHSRRHLG
jgi:hypothetical protein